jgi:hypothetical protein
VDTGKKVTGGDEGPAIKSTEKSAPKPNEKK